MFVTEVDAICTTLNAEMNRRLNLLMFSDCVEFAKIELEFCRLQYLFGRLVTVV